MHYGARRRSVASGSLGPAIRLRRRFGYAVGAVRRPATSRRYRVRSRREDQKHFDGDTRLPVLLAVLTVIATIGHMPPSAAAETGGAGGVEEAPALSNTPFDRQGMWVWYVEHSEGGSVPAIVARAKRAGIGTVYVKAGDGGSAWSQFSTEPGARRCTPAASTSAPGSSSTATRPLAEAQVGAAAVAKRRRLPGDRRRGRLRRQVRRRRPLHPHPARRASAPTFPLSLAGFPYVDYHPAFPYSVFFGPGGATFNQPQMYWKTIGTSVRAVFEHTYLYNRIWGHPIYPIGQTYEAPGDGAAALFRRFAASYGGLAPSWWDWQETSGREWGALGADQRRPPGHRLPPERRTPAAEARAARATWSSGRRSA